VSLLSPSENKLTANLANLERLGFIVVCWHAGQHTTEQPFTNGQDVQAGCSEGLNWNPHKGQVSTSLVISPILGKVRNGTAIPQPKKLKERSRA
jgi:hypothetical protein